MDLRVRGRRTQSGESEKTSPLRRDAGAGLVQRTLEVGRADDPLEREADRIAALVMRRLSVGGPSGDDGEGEGTNATNVRRAVQRRVSGAIGAAGGSVDSAAERAIRTSAGTALDSVLRSSMESAFGADFSNVRIHTGATSDDLNDRLSARAFTTGSNIFVRSSDYAPQTPMGQRLLAHELTHVVQQAGSRGMRSATAARPDVDHHSTDPGAEPQAGHERGHGQSGTGALTLLPAEIQRADGHPVAEPPARAGDGVPALAPAAQRKRFGAKVVQRAPIDVDAAQVVQFRNAHPGHDHLVAGIAAGQQEEITVVNRLIENFFSRNDFTYNFSFDPLFGHRGDCQTLRDEFITTAREAFGIDMGVGDIAGVHILTTPDGVGMTGSGPRTGSVDSRWWYFDSHHWAIWRDRPIDVLFGQWGVVSHALGTVEYDDKRNPTYRFPHATFYPKRGDLATHQDDRYTTDPGERFAW